MQEPEHSSHFLAAALATPVIVIIVLLAILGGVK